MRPIGAIGGLVAQLRQMQTLEPRSEKNQSGVPAVGLRLAFSVRETAKILGVSEKTVRRLISRGLLRASRALRHLLIAKKEIERFLDETTDRSWQ
jgi:excisionase family DNA binding protein